MTNPTHLLPDTATWREIAGQAFDDIDAWVAGAARLTDPVGARGQPLFVDARGRVVEDENDILRAEAQLAFPIRWYWPDQLAEAVAMGLRDLAAASLRIDQLERWCGLAGTEGERRRDAERGLERAALMSERQVERVRSTTVLPFSAPVPDKG